MVRSSSSPALALRNVSRSARDRGPSEEASTPPTTAPSTTQANYLTSWGTPITHTSLIPEARAQPGPTSREDLEAAARRITSAAARWDTAVLVDDGRGRPGQNSSGANDRGGGLRTWGVAEDRRRAADLADQAACQLAAINHFAGHADVARFSSESAKRVTATVGAGRRRAHCTSHLDGFLSAYGGAQPRALEAWLAHRTRTLWAAARRLMRQHERAPLRSADGDAEAGSPKIGALRRTRVDATSMSPVRTRFSTTPRWSGAFGGLPIAPTCTVRHARRARGVGAGVSSRRRSLEEDAVVAPAPPLHVTEVGSAISRSRSSMPSRRSTVRTTLPRAAAGNSNGGRSAWTRDHHCPEGLATEQFACVDRDASSVRWRAAGATALELSVYASGASTSGHALRGVWARRAQHLGGALQFFGHQHAVGRIMAQAKRAAVGAR